MINILLMCDRISPSDENFKFSQNLVKNDNCENENNKLTECLNRYKNDFKIC